MTTPVADPPVYVGQGVDAGPTCRTGHRGLVGGANPGGCVHRLNLGDHCISKLINTVQLVEHISRRVSRTIIDASEGIGPTGFRKPKATYIDRQCMNSPTAILIGCRCGREGSSFRHLLISPGCQNTCNVQLNRLFTPKCGERCICTIGGGKRWIDLNTCWHYHGVTNKNCFPTP